MQKYLRYFKQIDRNWLVVWAFIYFGFMSLALFWPDFFGVTVLRYTGIALSFAFAVKISPKDYLLQIALAFTLLADTILVVSSTSVLGVLVFCLAQFFHIARFAGTHPKNLMLYVVIMSAIITFGMIEGITPIYLFGFTYAIALGANLVLTHAYHRQTATATSACAFYGFVLFALCDLCVANSYLSFTGALPAFVYPLANYLAWACYYPSQILISNSSTLKKVR